MALGSRCLYWVPIQTQKFFSTNIYKSISSVSAVSSLHFGQGGKSPDLKIKPTWFCAQGGSVWNGTARAPGKTPQQIRGQALQGKSNTLPLSSQVQTLCKHDSAQAEIQSAPASREEHAKHVDRGPVDILRLIYTSSSRTESLDTSLALVRQK